MTKVAPEVEPEIDALLADLKDRLQRRFGERFVALYLFDSRARGDHEPESDVDVAVVLDQATPRPFDVTREILEGTYDLLLDTGTTSGPGRWRKAASTTPCPIPIRRSAAPCFATAGASGRRCPRTGRAVSSHGRRIG